MIERDRLAKYTSDYCWLNGARSKLAPTTLGMFVTTGWAQKPAPFRVALTNFHPAINTIDRRLL